MILIIKLKPREKSPENIKYAFAQILHFQSYQEIRFNRRIIEYTDGTTCHD